MLRNRQALLRWLLACVIMLLLSVWASGLSFSVVAVFAAIFPAGAALLSTNFPAPCVTDDDNPQPVSD